jgi:predicted membrane protein
MTGIALYAGVAVVCAVAAFLVAEWSRVPGMPAPGHPGVLALVAGLLWPVLIIGLAQFAAIVAAQACVRAAARKKVTTEQREESRTRESQLWKVR